MTTVAEVLRRGGDRLEKTCSDAPRLQARLLLSRATGHNAVWIYQNPHLPVAFTEIDWFERLVDRRLDGEPLRYLIGHVEFFGQSFLVDRRVLVPRPETEDLLEHALLYATTRRARQCPVRIAFDVGTGSGILAVTLAASLPEVTVIAIDRSWDALAVAGANATRHGVQSRTLLVQADLLATIAGTAELIVANLPYVPRHDLPKLPIEIQWEPRIALDGGSDGLDVYREFFAQCDRHLATPGLLIVEIGEGQGETALALVAKAINGADIRILSDSSGRSRFIVAERADPNASVVDSGRRRPVRFEDLAGEHRD